MPHTQEDASARISVDIDLNDFLAARWTDFALSRGLLKPKSVTQTQPKPVTSPVFTPTVNGLCLAFFHMWAAYVVFYAILNTLGYEPALPPDQYNRLLIAILVVSVGWSYALNRPLVWKYNLRLRDLAALRKKFSPLLQQPSPATIKLSATNIAVKLPEEFHLHRLDSSVAIIETADHVLLKFGALIIAPAKKKLSPESLQSFRRVAAANNILFQSHRATLLPLWASCGLSVAIFLSCAVIGANIKITTVSQTALLPPVQLGLADTSITVQGQVVNLSDIVYSASANQGVFYHSLSGEIGRPDISGTFFIDRDGKANLAQVAEAEFADERKWNLRIGKIPANATMEALPDSGVYIAWDQPSTAAYSGHCAALRLNLSTTHIAEGRVLWRGRAFIQACSSPLSAADVRSWMLQAGPALQHEFALLTQTPV